MSYTGKYLCLVEGCGFTCNTVASQGARGRQTMMAHGVAKHKLDWNTVGNEQFRPPPVVPEEFVDEPVEEPA